jgi:hypothetical protein
MKNIFEITETPTLENTSTIEKTAKKQKVGKKINTNILKLTLNGEPYFHFAKVEFDSEIATKNQDIVVSGKRYYKGIKNLRLKNQMKLSSIN